MSAAPVTEKHEAQNSRVSFLLTVAVYLAALLYLEIFCRLIAGFSGFSFYSVAFLVAEALLLAVLSGFPRRWSRILMAVWLGLLCLFYVIHIVYFSQFGQFGSIAMIGMGGDAISNFWWELRDTLRASLGRILLGFLPFFLCLTVFRLRRGAPSLRYGLSQRFTALVLAVLIWLSGVGLISFGGTDTHSAFAAYHSSLVDTDTSVSRLGTLTTTLLECVYAVGHSPEEGAEEDDLPIAAPVLQTPQPLPAPAEPPSDEEEGSSGGPVVEIDSSPNTLPEIDFAALSEAAPNSGLKTLCDYYAGVEGTRKNAYTGLLEGYNVIMFCGEAFDSIAIDPDLTPTLYRLSHEGLVLNNYYNSFRSVTTNGEYALMTGLWPDVTRSQASGDTAGTFCATANNLMPYGLGNVFASLGGRGFAYHSNVGYYYGRKYTHPNLGFECKFRDSGLSFSCAHPASDLELVEQTVDDYIGLDRFTAYYMTYSGHGNYNETNEIGVRNIDHVREVMEGRPYSKAALYYLAGNYELEKALSCLMERLEEAGKADKTVIILAGDHYPYCLRPEQYEELAGEPENSFSPFKSTCIFWFCGQGEPIVSDEYCCNVDILPTLLNLLGVPYESRLLSGTDILSDTLHTAVLYNRSFLTDRVMFDASRQTTTWLTDAADADPEELDRYLDYVSATVNGRYQAAIKIVSRDFFRYVWEQSGLA